MKVLVTGANGFIGKHVCLALKRKGHEPLAYDLGNTQEELSDYLSEADFIIHLAGINRPLTPEEFYDGNANFTKRLIDLLKASKRVIPIILSSSIQASLDNDYGKSKKMAEEYLLSSGLPVYVYRLANVFGKWCRPNYNSVCATFCHHIAHDLPIEISDNEHIVHFNYVEDVVNEFLNVVESENNVGSVEILDVKPVYDCSLGRLAELLTYYKKEVESDRHLPLLVGEFEYKLFKTFLSYLTEEGYSYNYAADERGHFEEIYKSSKWGQISENVAFPGVTKGGHYHTYKQELFYTVIGQCLIEQKSSDGETIITNKVDGDHPNPIDILPLYTHTITNTGKTNSHTLMWISEIYDPTRPDTYRK